MMKQGIPFEITLAQKKARYIILGSMTARDANKSNSLLDKLSNWTNLLEIDDATQASVMIADPQEEKVLWATNVGDNRVVMKLFESGGQRKLAKSIVDKMKKELFSGTSMMQQTINKVMGKDTPKAKSNTPQTPTQKQPATPTTPEQTTQTPAKPAEPTTTQPQQTTQPTTQPTPPPVTPPVAPQPTVTETAPTPEPATQPTTPSPEPQQAPPTTQPTTQPAPETTQPATQ